MSHRRFNSQSSVSSHISLDHPLSWSTADPSLKQLKFGDPLGLQTGPRHCWMQVHSVTPPNHFQWLQQGSALDAVQVSASSIAGRFYLENEGFLCLSTAGLNVLCVQTQGGEQIPNIFFNPWSLLDWIICIFFQPFPQILPLSCTFLSFSFPS